jgi:hypothetical protein
MLEKAPVSRRAAALGIGGLGGVALLALARVAWGQTAAQLAPPEIPFASPHAAAELVPSAPNAWGGVRTGSETTLSDRVVKYEIDASLDPKAHRVSGHERLTWRNRSDRRVHSVYLHLYLNAFEGPGSTFFSEERVRGFSFRSDVPVKDGDWGHIELTRVTQSGALVPTSFVQPDDGPNTDHTVVRLDLPSAVEPGASASFDLDFVDQLPRVIARTGWFGSYHLVAQWFPKIGVLELPGERGATEPRWNVHEFHLHSEFYADFGEFDVKLRVPKGFQVAAAGAEQGAPVEANGIVTHRFTQGDIHDFAWMAADDYAAPLSQVYTVPGGSPVTVKVFYPSEYAASAAPALQATLDSIRWFSETLGPYPYRTSTCIIPPYNAAESGGMEYQTFFTSEGFRAAEPDTADRAELDFVTIHEFGHGYFYGLLASNEFEEPLLDEGLNEYWDMRMLRARHQDIHVTSPFLKLLGFDPSVGPFEFERLEGGTEPHPGDPIGQNSWDRLSSHTFGQVYWRTATLMHDLEARFGSAAVERGFRAYYAKWHFRHPSVADFRESLIEGIGARAAVEQVFRQNVYGVQAVDDRVERISSVEELPLPGTHFEKGQWLELTQTAIDQQVEAQRSAWKRAHSDAKYGGPFPFRTTVTVRQDGAQVPQVLQVHFEDGSLETERWDDAELWHRFSFVKPVRATSAQLDPERKIFLDVNKLNDGLSVEPDGSAARRWAGDIAALVEELIALLGTL